MVIMNQFPKHKMYSAVVEKGEAGVQKQKKGETEGRCD